MDPENDIYGLAQQAGYLPPEGPAATPSYAEQQYSTPPSASFTDEDILAHYVPGYAQEDTTAAPAPPSPPADVLPPVPTKVKQGMNVSASGYSSSKNTQVRKGPGAALDQRIANVNAEGEARKTADQASFTDAAEEARKAAHGEAVATSQFITAEGHQKALLAKLQSDYDTQTQQVIAQGQAQAASAKANYVAALNDFRASRVNPTQLYESMTTPERIGTIAMAFVHDFLGAKGIQTSAMATLNKAIDRNIDAQVRAIQTKGQAAEGFKTLWDMQMAESHSTEEARTRMRTFMLDAAKTQIEANMAQFNSALATAKGQTAIAKIDEELTKNMFDVTKHIDAVTGQRVSQEIQRYGDELRASMESARIGVERERLAIEKRKESGQLDPYAGLIFDTSDSGGGSARWEFNADIKDPERQKYRDAQAATDHITKLSREYQELSRKFKNQGLTSGTRWSSSDDRRLRAVAGEILLLRQHKVTGAAATDAERNVLQAGTPQALFAGNGLIAPAVAQTERHIRQELEASRRQVAHPLHPADPRRKLVVPPEKFGEAEYAESGLIQDQTDMDKESAKVIQEGRIKGLEKHQANEPYTAPLGTPDDVKKDHERFLKENPELPFIQGDVRPGKAQVLRPDKPPQEIDAAEAKEFKRKGYVVREAGERPDAPLNFEAAITGLARDAQGYKERAAEGSKQDARRYEENVSLLRHIAAPALSGVNPEDPQARYALMKLGDLGEDTSPVYKEHTDTGDRLYTAPSDLEPEYSTTARESPVDLPDIPVKKRKR